MRLVTRLTGLTADTIRAWERRHRAITPHRSPGNTRRFSPDEVRRLMLLKEATDRGHSIGTIAPLSVNELEALVTAAEIPIERVAEPKVLDRHVELQRAYLGAIARFDARRSFDLMMRAATFLRPQELVFQVLVPILQEIGQRWSHGEIGVAQEHLASSQISGVLSALLRFRPPEAGAPQAIFTTPPGHRHEFGALIGALLAIGRGFDPLYLGADLPAEDLEWAVRSTRPRLLVLAVARDLDPLEAERLPGQLAALAARVEVWCGLPKDHALVRLCPELRSFHDFEAFDLALGEVTHREPER